MLGCKRKMTRLEGLVQDVGLQDLPNKLVYMRSLVNRMAHRPKLLTFSSSVLHAESSKSRAALPQR